jgi:hypothetical protein
MDPRTENLQFLWEEDEKLASNWEQRRFDTELVLELGFAMTRAIQWERYELAAKLRDAKREVKAKLCADADAVVVEAFLQSLVQGGEKEEV